MSSADFFYWLGDASYWLFINTLEPISDGDWVWRLVMFGGFAGFGYWMYRQHKYNQEAAADPNQLK
ncbi:MAG: hypothetical protein HUJ25_07840 [Crocinitomicaceae bacterium]|nr:hypothetical protein [Crocinitomicaceae bacterium]